MFLDNSKNRDNLDVYFIYTTKYDNYLPLDTLTFSIDKRKSKSINIASGDASVILKEYGKIKSSYRINTSSNYDYILNPYNKERYYVDKTTWSYPIAAWNTPNPKRYKGDFIEIKENIYYWFVEPPETISISTSYGSGSETRWDIQR